MADFSALSSISQQGANESIAATDQNVKTQFALSKANAESDIQLNGQRMMVEFAAATGKNMKAIGSDAKDAAG